MLGVIVRAASQVLQLARYYIEFCVLAPPRSGTLACIYIGGMGTRSTSSLAGRVQLAVQLFALQPLPRGML